MIDLWIIFALFSAISTAILTLVHRKIMLSEDPFIYAMIENIFVSIVFLFFITKFIFPEEIVGWIYASISIILWLIISVIGQYSYKYTPVSIRTPLMQTRIIIVFILSIIFLHEIITINKIFGTILIFCGLILISYDKKEKFKTFTNKGIQYTLITTSLFAIVTIIDKLALNYFNPETYGFLVYFVPGLILVLINIKSKKKKEFVNLIQKYWWGIFILVLTSFGFYYFKLKALNIADASLVFPIIRSGNMFAILGGIFILKEKDNLMKKILSSIIILIGIILLAI